MFPLCQSMFRTTLGCSSRFTVLGSFLFFRNFIILNKEFSGFGSLFSFHCSFCCCPFCYQRQLLYLITSVIVCQQLFYFFQKLFELYFNSFLRCLTGQHWKFVAYSRFLFVSLSATNINISHLLHHVNMFFYIFQLFSQSRFHYG